MSNGCDFTTTVTPMVIFVIDDTKLSWCNTMDEFFCMNNKIRIACYLNSSFMILWCMAYFKSYFIHIDPFCQIMKIHNGEFFLVCSLRVIAMADIEDIVLHIFLDNEPWSTSKSKTFTLAYCVEPQSAMFANYFPVSNSITSPMFSPKYLRIYSL